MNRVWLWGLLVMGCGGQCPEAASASSASGAEEVAPAAPAGPSPERESESEKTSAGSAKEDSPRAGDSPKSESDSKAADVGPSPTFPENASVAQAIAAVPTGTTRANIDQETLGEPLQNEAVYAPCNVGTQHFKLRVAVWNGQAVGVDVTTPNKSLAACIDKRVREVEWRHKVRSLNTVEYSM
jgi:hypothetical protein